MDINSHSIACGDDQTIDDINMSSQYTDARDMVKDLASDHHNFGVNTETRMTSE